jgi:hypothetical protein
MSQTNNEFLDAFGSVPDADTEREKQFRAQYPELEEEEKETTERDHL